MSNSSFFWLWSLQLGKIIFNIFFERGAFSRKIDGCKKNIFFFAQLILRSPKSQFSATLSPANRIPSKNIRQDGPSRTYSWLQTNSLLRQPWTIRKVFDVSVITRGPGSTLSIEQRRRRRRRRTGRRGRGRRRRKHKRNSSKYEPPACKFHRLPF